MIGAAATDPVVLESKRLQLNLVAEHRAELTHRIIVQVIIVKENLFESGVLDKGACDCL